MISDNIKEIRNKLNLNQSEFATKIGIKQAGVSAIEKGIRNATDRVISDICREFNVSEEWLRNGIGEMFVEEDTFSLDKFAKQQGCTDYELEILKSYFSIPADLRGAVLNHFKSTILPTVSSINEISATVMNDFESYKAKELSDYAIELDAEQKGETLSALENIKEA